MPFRFQPVRVIAAGFLGVKIRKIGWQSRSDFYATVECEHCNAIVTDWSGYDDHNYHANVMPKFHCASCGKNRAGELKQRVGEG